MTEFTIRIPDDRYQRLKQLAESRQTSLNRLFDEMATLLLTEQDVRTRLALRQGRGSAEGLLRALDGLDALDDRES